MGELRAGRGGAGRVHCSWETSAAKFQLLLGERFSCSSHSYVSRGVFSACSSVYRNKGRWGTAEQSVLGGEGRSGCLLLCVYGEVGSWMDGRKIC